MVIQWPARRQALSEPAPLRPARTRASVAHMTSLRCLSRLVHGMALVSLIVATFTACSLGSKPPTATSAAASADPASGWFAYVEALASDEMRGRETGSPEHRKAADYVAEHFKQAGLKPAGSSGYLQPVAFRSEKIDESQSSSALVRAGKPSRSPSVTRQPSACGSIQRRAWMRRSCSRGGDLIPEAKHDDFAALDVKGKVVVHLAGSPKEVPGR